MAQLQLSGKTRKMELLSTKIANMFRDIKLWLNVVIWVLRTGRLIL